MALYEGVKPIEGSRSKTQLVKSGHLSPAGDFVLSNKFITDPKLKAIWNQGGDKGGALFRYQYGGTGDEWVTISQGRFIGVDTPQFNFLDQIYKVPVALPGMVDNYNVSGMVPFNISKDFLEEDKFGAKKPPIITTEYVVLPWLPQFTPSTKTGVDAIVEEETKLTVENKMPWGCLIGEAQVGDFVKSTASGRATKWVRGTDLDCDRVGKILEIDVNQESWGWQKWMLLNPAEVDKEDKMMNRSGVSNMPTDSGYPFDPDYREGGGAYDILNGYQSQFTENPQGIAGLHDGTGNFKGYGRNDTLYTDLEIGVVPQGVPDDTMVVFNAVDYAGGKAKNIVADSVVVRIDGAVIGKENITVDEKYGTIAVKVKAAHAGKAVKADYKMLFRGTPSYLDFKGVVGSVSILLQM